MHLQDNYLFSQLPDADLLHMITAMARVTKQAGDIIIRQGHKGTEFFIMEKGQADVSPALLIPSEETRNWSLKMLTFHHLLPIPSSWPFRCLSMRIRCLNMDQVDALVI